MKPDFPLLYSQLGLNPDCSLDELKHAYRRRIAELHPDRQPPPQLPADDMTLPDLNSIYAMALRFHKQHGRLPGGKSPVAERIQAAARMQAPEPAPREKPSIAAAATDAGANPPRNFTLWILVLLLILILALFLDSYSSKTAAEPALLPVENARPAVVDPDAFAQLEIGMRAADVVALQGRPVDVRGEDWDYGPSWLRFDKRGRLADWHSSPLRPLKTATESPPEPLAE